MATCLAPGCGEALPRSGRGRPARFCSPACRVRAHRQRQRETAPLTVEVDLGSASSRGRPPERAWMVRLRRGELSVIVAIGLRRPAAERLAAAITELVGAPCTRAPSATPRCLGVQYCQPRGVFCRRLGVGGSCPSCEEAVAVVDLLGDGATIILTG